MVKCCNQCVLLVVPLPLHHKRDTSRHFTWVGNITTSLRQNNTKIRKKESQRAMEERKKTLWGSKVNCLANPSSHTKSVEKKCKLTLICILIQDAASSVTFRPSLASMSSLSVLCAGAEPAAAHLRVLYVPSPCLLFFYVYIVHVFFYIFQTRALFLASCALDNHAVWESYFLILTIYGTMLMLMQLAAVTGSLFTLVTS